jgi:hypothetical protein
VAAAPLLCIVSHFFRVWTHLRVRSRVETRSYHALASVVLKQRNTQCDMAARARARARERERERERESLLGQRARGRKQSTGERVEREREDAADVRHDIEAV